MIAIPKKAATVILLRESQPPGLEVFLLKRHEQSSFFGGNYVYPGGRIDPADGNREICPYCKGVTPEMAQQILGGALSPEESFAHWTAGVRELFEEAGILFAYDRGGTLFRPKDPAEQERFLAYRNLLETDELKVLQLVMKEEISLALDQLHYYDHWITPEARPQRFDTRFFIARHPLGQEASHDQTETTVGVWLAPREALEKNFRAEIVLSPPTLKTLEDLSRFERIDDVFNSLTGKEIRPILPVLTKVCDCPLLVFPWDPEYSVFQGGGTPQPVNHGRPSGPGDNTTRLLLDQDHWLPYCRNK